MAVLKGVQPAGPRRERHGHACGIQGLGDAISLETGKLRAMQKLPPGIQANSRTMAPGKGEVESLIPIAQQEASRYSHMNKPRDSQQVHSRTLRTTAETCRPLSSRGGLHLPQTTERPLSAPKAVLPGATGHLLCMMTLPTHCTKGGFK